MSQNAGPTKRMFTIGNYSRFVRPNFYRIDATSSQPSALISAYKDTNSAAFAIVVVNTNAATDVIQTFNLANFTAASVTPWITSATLSLAPQTPVNVTNSSFTYDVPAMSVVTFVGQEWWDKQHAADDWRRAQPNGQCGRDLAGDQYRQRFRCAGADVDVQSREYIPGQCDGQSQRTFQLASARQPGQYDQPDSNSGHR